MPNKKGGKKYKKNKVVRIEKNFIEKQNTEDNKQEYAKVQKMLGNGRCSLFCFDGINRLGIIRGSMRKRIWINENDYVLVSIRDFQDSKCDIIHKYGEDEKKTFIKLKLLPKSLNEEYSDKEKNIDYFSFDNTDYTDDKENDCDILSQSSTSEDSEIDDI